MVALINGAKALGSASLRYCNTEGQERALSSVIYNT